MEFVRNEVDALYHEMVVDAMGAQSEYNEGPMAEEPNSKVRKFYDLLHAAKVHIGAGGQDVTVLLGDGIVIESKVVESRGLRKGAKGFLQCQKNDKCAWTWVQEN
ncbi:hypothetical protein SLA2020_111150 [Shorea laevis]